jgi:hypothetical protein
MSGATRSTRRSDVLAHGIMKPLPELHCVDVCGVQRLRGLLSANRVRKLLAR